MSEHPPFLPGIDPERLAEWLANAQPAVLPIDLARAKRAASERARIDRAIIDRAKHLTKKGTTE